MIVAGSSVFGILNIILLLLLLALLLLLLFYYCLPESQTQHKTYQHHQHHHQDHPHQHQHHTLSKVSKATTLRFGLKVLFCPEEVAVVKTTVRAAFARSAVFCCYKFTCMRLFVSTMGCCEDFEDVYHTHVLSTNTHTHTHTHTPLLFPARFCLPPSSHSDPHANFQCWS